jgi:Holliday junction DNA helicase RuvA
VSNPVKEEAVSALVMLGFAANASQKAVEQILKSEPGLRVEQLIKLALKMM